VLAGDLVCPECGQPKHEAFNPDALAWYSVHDATCAGCAAIADDQANRKTEQPERKVWVVDDRPPDVPLMPWTPD
jgi:hypothetical protein